MAAKMLDNKDKEHTVTLKGELLEETDLGKFYIVNGSLDDQYIINYMLKVADWKH